MLNISTNNGCPNCMMLGLSNELCVVSPSKMLCPSCHHEYFLDGNDVSLTDMNDRLGILPGKTPIYFTCSLGSELSVFTVNNLEKINHFLDNFSAPL